MYTKKKAITVRLILPTNLVACKPTFYTIYTSHLRVNSTMRYCFYRTDLGQNAVFHNFAKQIALIQYSGRSKHAWAVLAKPLKKIPKSHIRPAGSHFCSASCSECLNEHTRVKLQHNKEIIIFIFYLMVYRCVIFKSV